MAPKDFPALLVVRIALCLAGAASLGAACWGGETWLKAASGAFIGAELAALALLTTRLESPTERTLLGTAEALPGITLSFLEPSAMVLALVHIVHAIIASGIATVSASAGKFLTQPRSESMRRAFAGGANVGLALILLHRSGVFNVERDLQISEGNLALLCAAVAAIGAVRAATDLALDAKWNK